MSLPRLILNRKFVNEFLAADTPSFAMGVVDDRTGQYAFLALRTGETIPDRTTARGFNFGYSVLGTSDFEVVHFAFEFYGFKTYNVLVNPGKPLTKHVLNMMIESGEYFFFAIGPDGVAMAFRSEVGRDNLAVIEPYIGRLYRSTTTDAQYNKAVSTFEKSPRPEGRMLNWICRENLDYLDLTDDIVDLNPV